MVIEVKPLSVEAWTKAIEEMTQKAIFAAKLLTGEMPQNIEEAFKAVGVTFFPESSKDIKNDCSCHDSANPCKHIAAVYYILAEEFDRDPFMLFNRGERTKEDITVSLRKKRVGDEKPKEQQEEAEKPKNVPYQQRVSGAVENSNRSLLISPAPIYPQLS